MFPYLQFLQLATETEDAGAKVVSLCVDVLKRSCGEHASTRTHVLPKSQKHGGLPKAYLATKIQAGHAITSKSRAWGVCINICVLIKAACLLQIGKND